MKDLLTLRAALAEHFGEDSEISSPEDESEAWKSIVNDFRGGAYPGLTQEIEALLDRSDQGIHEVSLEGTKRAPGTGTLAESEVLDGFLQSFKPCREHHLQPPACPEGAGTRLGIPSKADTPQPTTSQAAPE